jgi:hypothetical protein
MRTGMERCTGRCVGRDKPLHIGWDGVRHKTVLGRAPHGPTAATTNQVHHFKPKRYTALQATESIRSISKKKWKDVTAGDGSKGPK